MFKNKTLLFVFVILALALAACGGGSDAPRGGECLGTASDAIVDLDCQEITIAVENAYLPFNYVSLEDGSWLGWDYDAWEEICARLHCTPVFVEAVWDGMIVAVSDGQFDVGADGITITEERDEIVDFSMGYISTEIRILARIDEDRFATMEEFVANADLVMGTQIATTNYDTALDYLSEDRINAFQEFPFAVQALIAGEVDAVIIDDTAGQGYQGENADALKLIGESLSSDWLGFAYPNGSDLVEPVDQAIQSMIDDGFMADLNSEYFSPGFSITYDDIGDGAYGEE